PAAAMILPKKTTSGRRLCTSSIIWLSSRSNARQSRTSTSALRFSRIKAASLACRGLAAKWRPQGAQFPMGGVIKSSFIDKLQEKFIPKLFNYELNVKIHRCLGVPVIGEKDRSRWLEACRGRT